MYDAFFEKNKGGGQSSSGRSRIACDGEKSETPVWRDGDGGVDAFLAAAAAAIRNINERRYKIYFS